MKIKLTPVNLDYSIGYNAQITNPTCTLGEYVQALDDFCNNVMAPCRGCDGCCHERAPLMLCDFHLANSTNLLDWLKNTATITSKNGVIDIFLQRNDAGCKFLNPAKKECTDHLHRPFVCRTHICLAKTDAAENLRQDCVNAGIDSLIYAINAENPNFQNEYNFNLADYKNPNLDWENWQDIQIKNIVTPATWAKIYKS